MADWTNIPNESLEPDAPARSIDVMALRDNPMAIAEGAAGAPRVEDPALNTAATSAGRDWVLARTALAQVGAVGTYALLMNQRDRDYEQGETNSGSNLIYSSASSLMPNSVSPAGTWRAMGIARRSSYTDSTRRVTLWLRIS